MQNLFTQICCDSWEKLFFSCRLVCISMTRAFRCQYALENKAGIPASDAWRWHTVPPVYRRSTPQGSLRKAGIPASDVLRVKIIGNVPDSKYKKLYIRRKLTISQDTRKSTRFNPASVILRWSSRDNSIAENIFFVGLKRKRRRRMNLMKRPPNILNSIIDQN